MDNRFNLRKDEIVRDWVYRRMMLTEIADKWEVSTEEIAGVLYELVPGFVPSASYSTQHSSHYTDSVDHPPHYTDHPSGIECIEVTRHMNFNLGNALKYIWRAGKKSRDREIEDLRKAAWYIQDEIERLTKEETEHAHQ